ncbi:hypothetical protein [Oceanirhabdus seepicola]|uniref:HD domain-containing protein n=1 Tax=Oceanirhabdus seepicola TaxID=2828781 RepID=A0A9J6P4Z0_9CLOT|nr:hypothetical protein [Oceanirhabdus seepicola]MCM1991153.1 hypothetical protein [Oceanirhabdus seepicola]
MDKIILKNFAEGLLKDKKRDILHGIDHSDRMLKAVDMISANYTYDNDILMAGAYFHGGIHYGEEPIRRWLTSRGYNDKSIDKIIKVTWESQNKSIPETIEGKLLHDSHTIEGGKAFFILKPLLVGTVIGQTLEETIEFIENNIFTNEECYLPESKALIRENHEYAREFIGYLKSEIEINR